MQGRSRKSKSKEISAILHDLFRGHCFICGQFFTQDHHLIPYSLSQNHDPQDMAPICGTCHDLLTNWPQLFTIPLQCEIRRNAISRIKSVCEVESLLSRNLKTEACSYFLESDLFEHLITVGWYKKAENLVRRLLQDQSLDLLRKERLILLFADVNFWQGRHGDAKLILDKVETSLSGDIRNKALFLEIKGKVTNYIADDPQLKHYLGEEITQEDSIDFYNASLELDRESPRKSRILSSRASSQKSLENLDEAAEDCFTGIRESDETGDPRGKESNLDRLASIYIDEGEPEKALPLLMESMSLSVKTNHRRGFAYRLRHISRTLLGLGDHKNSLLAARLAMSISNTISDPNSIWIDTAIGEIRRELGQKRFEGLDKEVMMEWRRNLSRFPEK